MKTIIKDFPEIGQIEYKMVANREELEKSAALLYREYQLRGWVQRRYNKSGLRLTLYNALPETRIFIALKGKEAIGTITVIPDSPMGLPMDKAYKDIIDPLRRQKRRICEVGQLATRNDLFGKGLFSMFNFKKLNFIFTLFNCVFQYTCRKIHMDNLCIVVNPKAMLFKFLPFETMGIARYYGMDRRSVNRKPLAAKQLDLRTTEERVKHRQGLHKIFYGEKFSLEFFDHPHRMTPEDLRYFFTEKSDAFQEAEPQELDYILSCYSLSEDDRQEILIEAEKVKAA